MMVSVATKSRGITIDQKMADIIVERLDHDKVASLSFGLASYTGKLTQGRKRGEIDRYWMYLAITFFHEAMP